MQLVGEIQNNLMLLQMVGIVTTMFKGLNFRQLPIKEIINDNKTLKVA